MIPTAEVNRMAPHSFSGATVYCCEKKTRARPSPAWRLPDPSPTMAPTMLAVAVIYAVPATPGGSPFQPDDLLHEARVIEQRNPAAVDGRQ